MKIVTRWILLGGVLVGSMVSCHPVATDDRAQTGTAASINQGCTLAWTAALREAQIDSGGLGPIRIGMSRQALRDSCPGFGDSLAMTEMGDSAVFTPVALDSTLVAVAAWSGREGTLQRLLIFDPRRETSRSLRVGSTMAELRSAHRGLTAGYADEGVFVWDSTERGISFLLSFRALEVLRNTAAVDGHPELLPDTSRVRWIVVSASN